VKWKKLKEARSFCKYLDQEEIDYQYCIKHPEVLGCQESKLYYQRFQAYIGSSYGICKHLVLRERKGEKRYFLIVTGEDKSVDLKKLREQLECGKLEFAKEEDLETLLQTYPGNVSIFHLLYDTEKKVNLVLDQELLQYPLLAFHPLYNGMSLFLEPEEVLKFLERIERVVDIEEIPEVSEYCLVKNA